MRRVPVGGVVDLEPSDYTEDQRSRTLAHGPWSLFWPRNDPDPIELADAVAVLFDPDAVTVEDRTYPEQRFVTIGRDALPTPDSSVEARKHLRDATIVRGVSVRMSRRLEASDDRIEL